MRLARLTSAAVAATLLAASATGCEPLAGANPGESRPGNEVGGNELGEELALSSNGRFLVLKSLRENNQGIYAIDFAEMRAVQLSIAPLDGGFTTRMVFGNGEHAYFLGHEHGEGTVIREVSLVSGERKRRWSFEGRAGRLSIDGARQRIAVWNRQAWHPSDGPVAEEEPAVGIVDLDEGDTRVKTFSEPTRDVRWVPTTRDLAVVQDLGFQESRLTLLEGEARTRHEVQVPNCASSLEIAPQGDMAMLAPSNCEKDPVSVIDLTEREFVKNLPGFGPVDFSPGGDYAVAFARQDDLRRVADIDTETAYSLLFIDTDSLELDVVELGDSLPLYTVTPDGEVVLIYSKLEGHSYDGIVMVDVQNRTIRRTHGPEIALEEFVMTPDGRLVYLVDGGLFRLDVDTGRIEYVRLSCDEPGKPSRCNPDLVNIFPDGEQLVLGWRYEAEFSLFDVDTETLTDTFRIDPDTGQSPEPVVMR